MNKLEQLAKEHNVKVEDIVQLLMAQQKKKRKSIVKVEPREEYTLINKDTCTACYTLTISFFHMIDDKEGCSRSKEVFKEVEGLPVKIRESLVHKCKFCEAALMMLSKEELITRLIKEIRAKYQYK